MTVAELKARMSEREFREWHIYHRLEPFGALRDNLHAGIIAAVIANLFNKGKPLTAVDFIISGRPKRQTAADMKAQCLAIHQQMIGLGMQVKDGD